MTVALEISGHYYKIGAPYKAPVFKPKYTGPSVMAFFKAH